jgi:hypothetical protein
MNFFFTISMFLAQSEALVEQFNDVAYRQFSVFLGLSM